MKKLVVSGWISFVMLVPAELFTCTDEIVAATLVEKLNEIDKFSQALYDTEYYTLLPHNLDNLRFWRGDEILLSGDNGNIYLQLQEVDDFEVFF